MPQLRSSSPLAPSVPGRSREPDSPHFQVQQLRQADLGGLRSSPNTAAEADWRYSLSFLRERLVRGTNVHFRNGDREFCVERWVSVVLVVEPAIQGFGEDVLSDGGGRARSR